MNISVFLISISLLISVTSLFSYQFYWPSRIVAFIILYFISFRCHRISKSRAKLPPVYFLALFLLSLFFYLPFSSDSYHSSSAIIHTVFASLFAFPLLAPNQRLIYIFTTSFVAISVILSVNIFASALSVGFFDYSSFILDKNPAAFFLLCSILLLHFSNCTLHLNLFPKYWKALSTLFIIATILTFSFRSIAAFAMFALFLHPVIVGFSLLSLIFLTITFSDPLLQYIGNSFSPAGAYALKAKVFSVLTPSSDNLQEYTERASLVTRSFESFWNSPLVGNGLENSRLVLDGTHAHNTVIELSVGTGIIGLLLFTIFFLSLYICYNCRPLSFPYLVPIVIISFFQNVYSLPIFWIYSILIITSTQYSPLYLTSYYRLHKDNY